MQSPFGRKEHGTFKGCETSPGRLESGEKRELHTSQIVQGLDSRLGDGDAISGAMGRHGRVFSRLKEIMSCSRPHSC